MGQVETVLRSYEASAGLVTLATEKAQRLGQSDALTPSQILALLEDEVAHMKLSDQGLVNGNTIARIEGCCYALRCADVKPDTFMFRLMNAD